MSTHYDNRFDGWDDEPDYPESEFFDHQDDDWGCVFGEQCCMPGYHTTDECHTPEMAEEWMREAEGEQP